VIGEDGKYGIADGIQAVKVVRAHAAELGISPDRIVFTGFSAGRMITSTTPSRRPDTNRNFTSLAPAVMASACANKVHRAITGSTSPTTGWKRKG
jgi:predicted esterase